jgi:hypothetical protein
MNVELIKEEVVPVFKPMTVQVTIGTQEEYDAIQRAGNVLIYSEIKAMPHCIPYSRSERKVWVGLLELIAQETKNVN